MPSFKRFQGDEPALPGQSPGKLPGLLLHNLEEMKKIMDDICRERQSSPKESRSRLLYIGSHLYDYYLLAENCLLQIARTFDRWAPTSLDWRGRLIKAMQGPVEESRPAVLSKETYSMLTLYLAHFQNYNNQSSSTFAKRVEMLADKIELFQSQFEKEIKSFLKPFMR